MAVTVSRSQRGALREQIVAELASVGDIFRALDAENPNEARTLRHRYHDYFRLLDDLGWGEADPGRAFAITMDLDALVRALTRLHERAAARVADYVDGSGADRREVWDASVAMTACGDILLQLTGIGAPEPPPDGEAEAGR